MAKKTGYKSLAILKSEKETRQKKEGRIFDIYMTRCRARITGYTKHIGHYYNWELYT
jgi:hypothetical protein